MRSYQLPPSLIAATGKSCPARCSVMKSCGVGVTIELWNNGTLKLQRLLGNATALTLRILRLWNLPAKWMSEDQEEEHAVKKSVHNESPSSHADTS